MDQPLPMWRRLWASLPLLYKVVLFGLGTIMTATVAVMVVTYLSAGDSLKLQLERQVSRDLNVLERWYLTGLEDMQLTGAGLALNDEVAQAVAHRSLGAAAPLLDAERRRLGLHWAMLVDDRGRLLGPKGEGAAFDPKGVVSLAIARHAPVVGTESWGAAETATLPAEMRESGLVRLVVTPVGRGAVVLGSRVDARSAMPEEVNAMIGGAIGLLDTRRPIAFSGFPNNDPPAFPPEVWEQVGIGKYFFSEQKLNDEPYMLAFRPLLDHEGRTVGAFVRGFPEAEIGKTLHRYASNIFMLTGAAVVFSVLALLGLTRQLLFPLRRLVRISQQLGAADEAPVTHRVDELVRLERGVERMADRLSQSREELADAAVRLEEEAQALAERNAQLARLNGENARLLAAIRDHDRLRGQLIEKIITAQEDERKRIARELHDETGQSLTGLLVGLKFVEGARTLDEMRDRTGDLKQLTVRTLEEVHKLSVALRPAMLDDLGLVVAVRSLVKDAGAQMGVKAEFTAEGLDGRLPPLWEVTLYRIVQEALTNAAKYARASRVSVRFERLGDRLRATISDDGVGFDPAVVGRDGREHLGLLGMQERIALIGGQFRLHTAPGQGTRVEVEAVLGTPDVTVPGLSEGAYPHA